MAMNCGTELISSLANHINPEKDDQLKKTKTEIDEKAAKIIKLIKARNQRKRGGGSITNSEIITLVEDFHRQYLSLYALHVGLKEDLREKVRVQEDKDEREEEATFTAYNAEDSYFSADEISVTSSPGCDHIRRDSYDFNLKPNEEKEALKTEYTASLIKIKEPEKIIDGLKVEVEEIASEKQKLVDEISQLMEKCAESEKGLVSLQEEQELRVRQVTTREEKLETEISSLKLEGTKLCGEKRDLQEQIEGKVAEAKQLGEENLKLQAHIKELEKVSQEKEDQLSALMKKLEENENDSILKIDKVNQELSDFHNQIVDLEEKQEYMAMNLRNVQDVKDDLQRQVKDLEQTVDSITSEKIHLEMQMEKNTKEAEQLRVENEELHDRISKLEKLEKKRVNELSAMQTDLEGLENYSSFKIKSSEEEVKKLQEKMKLNVKILEKKIEDTAEGFCKELEDKIRILSRRIRVSEQLHMENKEIYMKTKEQYEGYKDMIGNTEVAVKMMRGISVTANEILDKSDTAAIKFNEQSENFLNRISKVSCEVLFAKEWIRRKNKALKSFQEDADNLLIEMGKKESEILGLRERVWKSENKVRELEKLVKEKDDGILSAGEEKREAIRQLCIRIEYHRSRSDSLKKILSDMTTARRQKIA